MEDKKKGGEERCKKKDFLLRKLFICHVAKAQLKKAKEKETKFPFNFSCTPLYFSLPRFKT